MFDMNPFEYLRRINKRVLEERQKFIEKCEKEEKYRSDTRKGRGYERETFYHHSPDENTKVWTLNMRYTSTDINKPNYSPTCYYIADGGEESMTDEELYDFRKEQHRVFSSFDDDGKLKDNRIEYLDGFNTSRVFRSDK